MQPAKPHADVLVDARTEPPAVPGAAADHGDGISRLLSPRTVAVLGVSDRRPTWGSLALRLSAQSGFGAGLYGVSRRAPIDGLDGVEVVTDLAAVPGPIDCALVAVGKERTLEAVRECAEKGVSAAVLVGAGFGELGADGRALERAILDVARSAGMRLLGPNCIGLFRAERGVCFTPFVPPAGSVALLTQSGNAAISLGLLARRTGIGFSTCVGLGNQIDISFGELLEWLATDVETNSVGVYLEGLPPGTGAAFVEGLRRCAAAGKAVVVLRGGTTAAGSATVATHTGSLAGDAKVWAATLRREGAVTVESLQAMSDALSAAEMMPAFSGGVMVLTDGGGDSVMTTDALSRHGLPLAELSDHNISALGRILPPASPRHAGLNPVTLDTPGGLQDEPRLLAGCAEIAAADPGVGALLIAGLFGGYAQLREAELETAARLGALRTAGVPIAVATAYDSVDTEVPDRLRSIGIPVYRDSSEMVAAIATRYLSLVPDGKPIMPAVAANSDWPTGMTDLARASARLLPLMEARDRLAAAGVPMPPMRRVTAPEGPEAIGAVLGWPVCLKVDVPGLVHKSDVGGVRLGVGPEQVGAVAAELWERFPGADIVAMPMLESGFEVLVGLTWDPTFGAVILVGRGGIWAEVEADTEVLVLPASEAELEAAVASLRCYPMMTGSRGQPRLDLGALTRLLSAVSKLAEGGTPLTLDMNPVILYPEGLSVADFAWANLGVANLEDLSC